MECEYCGEELEGEELESPHRDPAGNVMCDDCYEEYFTFPCYLCENSANVEQRNVGHLLVVNDAEECRIARGVYRIKELPYYTSDYFNMWFIEEALELTDIPVPELVGRGYPSGHLCYECEQKLLRQGVGNQPVPLKL
jgi:hypothetical protein